MRLIERRNRFHVVRVIGILSADIEVLAENLAVMVRCQSLRPGVCGHELPSAEPSFNLGLERVVPGSTYAAVAIENAEELGIRPEGLCKRLSVREVRVRLLESCCDDFGRVDRPLKQGA